MSASLLLLTGVGQSLGAHRAIRMRPSMPYYEAPGSIRGINPNSFAHEKGVALKVAFVESDSDA